MGWFVARRGRIVPGTARSLHFVECVMPKDELEGLSVVDAAKISRLWFASMTCRLVTPKIPNNTRLRLP